MFFSNLYKKNFSSFCIKLKDLYAKYTDFENASWRILVLALGQTRYDRFLVLRRLI
jgi:hypothetical protein